MFDDLAIKLGTIIEPGGVDPQGDSISLVLSADRDGSWAFGSQFVCILPKLPVASDGAAVMI